MEPDQKSAYYNSTIHAGLIFGLIYFLLNLFVEYQTMQLSPDTNPLLNVSTYGTAFICLITLVGGLLGVWLYSQRSDEPLSLGQGAGMGAIIGFIMIIVTIILEYIWATLNPDFYEQVLQNLITLYENTDLPDELKQASIDQLYNSYQNKFSLGSILLALLGGTFNALLNALSAMLGVKLFISQPDEF